MKKNSGYNINSFWRKVDDEAVILGMDDNSYYSINDIGTRMWELLNEGKTQKDIIEVVSAEYDVDPSRVRKDLGAFIRELKKEKLVNIG
ncbi:MAG: PqqD family protein [Endomicrobiales bacterium]|nr:PqqD family protein [Endomicrobiales bacterium]